MPEPVEAQQEATALIQIFGEKASDAVHRRIALAIDRSQYDDAMFWLDVQSFIYLIPYR